MSSGSLLFDGSNEFITFGNVLDNDGTVPFSVSYWYCSNVTSGDRATIAKQSGAGTTAGWAIYHTNNNLIYFLIQQTYSSDCVLTYCQDATPYANATPIYVWRHLVVTYDGSQSSSGVKFYIDGVLRTTNTTFNTFVGSSSNAQNLTIGSRDGGAFPLYWNGYLDDVAIWWGTVLAQSDVDELYNNFDPPQDLSTITTPPNGWWPFGDATASWPTVSDAIDGYDGTATNMESTDVTEQVRATYAALDADIVNIGVSVIGSVAATTYYKMTGRDSSCPTPTYHSWVVTGSPDFAGDSAGTLPCGGPLVDIYIADQWSV